MKERKRAPFMKRRAHFVNLYQSTQPSCKHVVFQGKIGTTK